MSVFHFCERACKHAHLSGADFAQCLRSLPPSLSLSPSSLHARESSRSGTERTLSGQLAQSSHPAHLNRPPWSFAHRLIALPGTSQRAIESLAVRFDPGCKVDLSSTTSLPLVQPQALRLNTHRPLLPSDWLVRGQNGDASLDHLFFDAKFIAWLPALLSCRRPVISCSSAHQHASSLYSHRQYKDNQHLDPSGQL